MIASGSFWFSLYRMVGAGCQNRHWVWIFAKIRISILEPLSCATETISSQIASM